MLYRNYFTLFALFVFLFISCAKDDLPIEGADNLSVEYTQTEIEDALCGLGFDPSHVDYNGGRYASLDDSAIDLSALIGENETSTLHANHKISVVARAERLIAGDNPLAIVPDINSVSRIWYYIPPNDDFNTASVVNTINTAAHKWNVVPGSRVRFIRTTQIGKADIIVSSRKGYNNWPNCSSFTTGNNSGAATFPTRDNLGTHAMVDIEKATQLNGGVLATCMHELGHVLGFRHSVDESSNDSQPCNAHVDAQHKLPEIMIEDNNSVMATGNNTSSSFSQLDIDAIQMLFPDCYRINFTYNGGRFTFSHQTAPYKTTITIRNRSGGSRTYIIDGKAVSKIFNAGYAYRNSNLESIDITMENYKGDFESSRSLDRFELLFGYGSYSDLPCRTHSPSPSPTGGSSF